MAYSLLCGLAGCRDSSLGILKTAANPQPPLEAMSVAWGASLKFEQDFLRSFGKRNGVQTAFIPNTRLDVYRQLLRSHAKAPDLLELDIVWPSILAEDLVDLRPYLKGGEKAFPPQLLQNYIVGEKLVALPVYADVGVLYYRPELLEKYGYRKPPATWAELETMAARIQADERRAGNKDFWGYVWQGSVSEAGTCNALEWQSAAAAGNFIEPSGAVHVRSTRFASALRRSANWIGAISPPAEYVYLEDDAVNLWDAGQAAFMRNWASGYAMLAKQPGHDRRHFAVAPLPSGPGGHKGALGGVGLAVSKYAANRELAIKALLEYTNEASDFDRSVKTEAIPSHSANLERSDLKARSPLLAIAAELMNGAVARPALITGEKYDLASHEYALAVNSVLRRKATPEAAMAELEGRLMKITGFPAQRD